MDSFCAVDKVHRVCNYIIAFSFVWWCDMVARESAQGVVLPK